MKKVTSILAVAVMTLGLVSTAIQNTNNEFDFLNDISKALTCNDCDAPLGDRIPPKKIA
ncbi:MAG: hypothetical protein ABJL43_11765 [Maribacter dokdonensis]|uniref:hypothetical protein n=1 Tax=Maribacter dokdonensis TaxID=320912 RepID=UPI0007293581|nr:hypothetical protein [Maribacter dokdonensis]KSA13937.1 hypothetical protein I600_530 [Maribacter dokdonensis DSW-8]